MHLLLLKNIGYIETDVGVVLKGKGNGLKGKHGLFVMPIPCHAGRLFFLETQESGMIPCRDKTRRLQSQSLTHSFSFTPRPLFQVTHQKARVKFVESAPNLC